MDRGAWTEGYRPWGYKELNMTKHFTFISQTDVAALVVPTQLMLNNKLPHTPWLTRTHIYYLTISVNVESVFCAQSLTELH